MNEQTTFKIRTREEQELLEEDFLAPYALCSRGAHQSRRFAESEHPYRTAFQRDRDRIIHSRAFRRLKHKRQVFLTTESDHYRTRITHTLEVSQLSRTMARALGLNEDLVEAIALGHDLGHTPFGHLGEVILNEIMSGKTAFQGQTARNFGGFKHNYQSLRVVDKLEKKYAFDGLNLTAPVREGIIKHTRLKRGDFDYPDFDYTGLKFERDVAATIEAQVVAMCDEIAQRTHDLEDGIRAGLVDLKKIRELEIVRTVEKLYKIDESIETEKLVYQGRIINGLINFLVNDAVTTTLKNLNDYFAKYNKLHDFHQEMVAFSPGINRLQKLLNKFIYKEIIDFSRVKWSDELGEKLLYRLFEAYYRHPQSLPPYVLDKVSAGNRPGESGKIDVDRTPDYFRIVCDYIAGMTDSYAVREAGRLSRDDKFDASGLSLDVALGLKSNS